MPEEKNSGAEKYQKPGKTKKTEVVEDRPQKQVKSVIENQAVAKKKGFFRKLQETFTGEDMHNVIQYVTWDIAIPALKSMVSDMVSNGAERLLFGDAAQRRGSSGRPSSPSNANRYHRASDGRPAPVEPRSTSSTREFKDIIFQTRGEAEKCLDQLTFLIEEYGTASVADLYESVEWTSESVHEKWGWDTLRDARILRSRGGFILDLPRAIDLD